MGKKGKTMDFKFNEMEQEIIDMLHDFCIKEVKPIAAELDEKEQFTQNAREKLAEMGMLGTYIPEEYGGAGLSYLTYIACCEELAKYCASTSIMFSVHGSLCSWPILEFGTEEQKQKYLVPLAQGEKLGAMGLTEPSAGTDAAGVRTTAVLKGDKYILNGTKIFITNGYYADTYVIFARTNPDLSLGHKGLSAFNISEWYGEYGSAHANFRNIFGGDTAFDELITEYAAAASAEEASAVLVKMEEKEQELLYKLPLFTLGNNVFVNTDKVSVPEGTRMGNPWYRTDIGFENWELK